MAGRPKGRPTQTLAIRVPKDIHGQLKALGQERLVEILQSALKPQK